MRLPEFDVNILQARSAEGKGTAGCMVFLVLLAIAVLIGVKIGPDYYSFSSLKADVKTEASRAGAHFLDDETIVSDIMAMARTNEIRLTKDNVKIERFAGQLFLTVQYSVSQDFLVYQRTQDFVIKASSFIGQL